MKQIRKGVFETNSSSTHTMCIACNTDHVPYPNVLEFKLDRFNWSTEVLQTVEDRASYLYTSLVCMYIEGERVDNGVAQIAQSLHKLGIECEFQKPIYERFHSDREYVFVENGNVDHVGEDDHEAFINDTIYNPTQLADFLFSPQSYVLIDNDNKYDDCVPDDMPKRPVDRIEYYKGN